MEVEEGWGWVKQLYNPLRLDVEARLASSANPRWSSDAKPPTWREMAR